MKNIKVRRREGIQYVNNLVRESVAVEKYAIEICILQRRHDVGGKEKNLNSVCMRVRWQGDCDQNLSPKKAEM